MTRLLVVGGGISGLAAAWEGMQLGASVTVVEGTSRVGGVIGTTPFGGLEVDTAADSFLARVPDALKLATELGLPLVAPATGNAFLWSRGALRPIPPGLVLGVPSSPTALLRSQVVSRAGALRAALDRLLPGAPSSGDVSVGALIRGRMGAETLLRVVDPLVGGINAGHTDELSAEVVAPQLLAAARRDRSLMRGLSSAPAAPSSDAPVFLAVEGGMQRLTDALRSRLASVITGDPVVRLTSGWKAELASGQVLEADAVVVACPARDAAPLLADLKGGAAAAAGLATLRTASVVLVTLAYDHRRRLEGSGFLVPRPEGRLMTACTFLDSKWPHLAQPGRMLVRVSAGRSDDRRALELDDGALVDVLHRELTMAIGPLHDPAEVRVTRHLDAFPQYAVGHVARMDHIRRDLPAGLALAGSYVGGVGIATCVRIARSAARVLLAD